MALEALEDIFGKEKKDVGAINALRQALNETPPCKTHPDTPLYTAPPPQKEWVGLTDEEGAEIWADAHDIRRKRLVSPKEIVRRIEAKLWEKNHD